MADDKNVYLDTNAKKCIRANFHSRGLWKVVPNVRSLDLGVPDPNAIVQIARMLKDLRYDRKVPQRFASIPELEGLDYIGYIIEKERLDKVNNTWVRIDEFRILGTKAGSFKDSRVAYGQTYRYKMRAVVKYTKAVVKESFEKFDMQEDVRALEAEVVQKSLDAQRTLFSSVDKIVNAGVSSKSSLPDRPTTFQLMSNIAIHATSDASQLNRVAASKSVRSLSVLRRQNNSVVKDPEMMTGNIGAEKLQKIITRSIAEFIDQKFEFWSYYYESESSCQWRIVNVVKTTPPPPPQSIKIIPNTLQRQISISWLAPATSTRDIKQFRLYKREYLGQPWAVVKTFDLGDNLYEDKAVRLKRRYIYALTSIDAHGIESVLSMQIQAELNPQFATQGVERPLKWFSGSGARPDRGFTNVFKKFFEPEVPIVAKKNVVFGPQREFADKEKKFLVRIKSLDIHERKEFVLTLVNENTNQNNVDLPHLADSAPAVETAAPSVDFGGWENSDV